jgi:hypothetical protein
MRISLFFLLMLAACSTPTGYVAGKNEDAKGFKDSVVSQELRMATFQGNEKTEKTVAELYAKFRSIEVCQELGKKFSHILLVKDRTHTEEVTETASVAAPSYYYGVSPYYGAMTPIPYTTPTQTISKSRTYPAFDVYFECVDKPFDARISFQNLSHSQVKDIVKDMMGAVQIDEVLSESPNLHKLQKGDIIYKVDGQRVGKILDVYEVSRRNAQAPVKVDFFREGQKRKTTVTYKDVTDLVKKAQEEIIKSACNIGDIESKSSLCKSK